jgi:hypothetical protein
LPALFSRLAGSLAPWIGHLHGPLIDILTFDSVSAGGRLRYITARQHFSFAKASPNMRQITKLLVFLSLLVSAPVAVVPFQQPLPQTQSDMKTETVYVTRTGKKYHRGGCRYLAGSEIPMSIKDAQAKGYTPCKICHPPTMRAGI